MQTTYLSTNGLQELLRVAPRVMMSLDVLAEEREGEVVYNIQNNKRLRCTLEEGDARGSTPLVILETVRAEGVIAAFSVSLSRLDIEGLARHSERIRGFIHSSARMNGLLPSSVGIQAPQMMTVYKFLIHQKIGGIEERGVWCVSRVFSKFLGGKALRRLDDEKKNSAPHQLEIWMKRIQIPSYEELRDQVVMYLLRLGAETLLRENCLGCDEENNDADDHTCDEWPTSAEGKLDLLKDVAMTVMGLNAYMSRINAILNDVHYVLPSSFDLDALRQRCTRMLLNDREVSCEFEHLMQNLEEIEEAINEDGL